MPENEITCDVCGKPAACEFFARDGVTSVIGKLETTNSAGTWRQVTCGSCWEAFKARAFCTITRKGNTFTATCAF